jgi:hypothetical protein
MELVVIFLIALELIASAWGIFLTVRESKEQAQIMERLIKSMDAVEKSTRQAGQLNFIK